MRAGGTGVVATCVVAFAVAAVSSSAEGATSKPPKPKPKPKGQCAAGAHRTTVNGKPAVTFCGRASAVVHFGGRTVTFRNGTCAVLAGRFTIDIGTEVVGLSSGKPPYFGVATHTARPGAQHDAALSFTSRGRGYDVTDQVVTLAPGLKRGTFSGRILGSQTKVSGSFHC
jgi:hypothetical protein